MNAVIVSVKAFPGGFAVRYGAGGIIKIVHKHWRSEMDSQSDGIIYICDHGGVGVDFLFFNCHIGKVSFGFGS